MALTSDGLTLALTDRSSSVLNVLATATNTLGTPITITGPGAGVCVYPSALFPPPTPPYPGGQFIPKLFIPIKGKVTEDYTADELMDNWIAIERWAQQWIPPAPVTLFFPSKRTVSGDQIDANWVTLEVWANMIRTLGAPYSPILVPRKGSLQPTDLDIDFLTIQNWANRLPN
jgi:hypothetical protein